MTGMMSRWQINCSLLCLLAHRLPCFTSTQLDGMDTLIKHKFYWLYWTRRAQCEAGVAYTVQQPGGGWDEERPEMYQDTGAP